MNRSRSPFVSLLAFLRMRTISSADPTSVFPTRASILTSPLLVLGWPNLPAVKNGTVVPSVGTVSVSVFANAPVVPLRKPIAPPLAADTPAIVTLTVAALAPKGLLTRIRHGDGAHVTNRAPGVMLLLICSSMSIHQALQNLGNLGGSRTQPPAQLQAYRAYSKTISRSRSVLGGAPEGANHQ